jgi:hypothetical protein
MAEIDDLKASVVVARRARAWIETPELVLTCLKTQVARRTRAWIETNASRSGSHPRVSPAAHGRGLKLGMVSADDIAYRSPAARGRRGGAAGRGTGRRLPQ